MKAVSNISGQILNVDFNGETYHFDKTPVIVEEDLFNHLKERYPLAFDFEFKSSKPVSKVKSTKTVSKFERPITDGGVDMRAGLKRSPEVMFNEVDGLPSNGNIDKDGVEWSGETIITGGDK
jgi:hypothetical protein